VGPSFLSCGPLCLQVMLQQRNAKMARALRHLEGKVVAVVGMAHLDGIEQLWQEQNDKVRQDRQVRHAASRATPVVLCGGCPQYSLKGLFRSKPHFLAFLSLAPLQSFP
jgi:pheromone shutdown protein TraB